MHILSWNWPRIAQWSVFALLAFVILWKGGKSLDATWLLVGVAGLVTFIRYWNKSDSISSFHLPNVLWWSLILFVGWSVLSYVFSTTQNYGLDEILRDGSLILLLLWVVSQPEESRHKMREAVASVIVYSTFVACIIGIAVYVLQPVSRFVGTFFDFRFHTDYWPNAWAEYLLLAWPMVLLWALKTTIPRTSFARCALLGFVIGSLALSYSRGAILVFVGQAVLLIVLSLISGPTSSLPAEASAQAGVLSPKSLRLGLLIMAVAMFTFFTVNTLRSQFYPVQSVTEKITFTADEGGSSVSERRDFWNQAWLLSRERPLFGWGPYSFRFVQPRLQTEVLATSDHPHNVFLKLAMERGLPAAILFAIVIICIVFHAVKSVQFSLPAVALAEAGSLSIQTVSVLIAVLGVLAHNLIDFNLQFVGIALPFWLLLSMLVPSQQQDQFLPVVRLRRGAEIALAALLLVIAVLEGRYLVISSIGRHAEARGDWAQALEWYERAEGEAFARDLHLSRAHVSLNRHLWDIAEEALDTYLARNEEDVRAWQLQGELAFKQWEYPQARRAFDEAMRLARFDDLGTVLGSIQTLMKVGDRETLDERREKIDDLLEQYANAIEVNRHFIALGPNVEEFLTIVNLLAEVYPEEAPSFQVLGARVDRAAKREREKLAARKPGYFW